MDEPGQDGVAYKIMTAEEVRHLRLHGVFDGSAADVADGFIHMSTAAQLPATIAAHYRGRDGLMLVAVDVAGLGDVVRWEASRGGQLFPHAYGVLPMTAVLAIEALEQAADGSVKLPAPSVP